MHSPSTFGLVHVMPIYSGEETIVFLFLPFNPIPWSDPYAQQDHPQNFFTVPRDRAQKTMSMPTGCKTPSNHPNAVFRLDMISTNPVIRSYPCASTS